MCRESDLDSLRGSVTAFNEEVAALAAGGGISAQGFRLLGEEGTRRLIELIRRRIGFPKKPGHTGACEGVYVAYVDYDGVKRIIDPESWSDDLGAPQGIMVGDGTHEVMCALEMESGLYFSNDSSSSPNKLYGVITTDIADCLNDYNGRLNTEAIINMGGDYASADYIPGYCHNYAYGCTGAGEWWLPSAGEIGIMTHYNSGQRFFNYTKIFDVFTILGKDYQRTYYPVSTIPDSDDYGNFFSSYNSVIIYRGRDRLSDYPVWPVSSFDYVLQ